MALRILYHYPCIDGVWAAWAAHQSLFQQGLLAGVRFVPNRVFRPCTIQELDLQGTETVFLLDFVGPPGFCRQLAASAHRVIVVDHHKTAASALTGKDDLPSNLEVHLDMQHSGAMLALQHFHPQVSEEHHQIIKWVEDADLWRWALKPDSEAFHAGFAAMELEYDASINPGIFDALSALKSSTVLAKGREVLQENARLVDEAAEQAFVIQLGGSHGQAAGWGRCLAVRGDQVAHLRSQLGHELATRSRARGLDPVALVAYVEPGMQDPSKVKCSLRSLQLSESDAAWTQSDTTRVSQYFEGGGHRNASSFIIALSNFLSWKVS